MITKRTVTFVLWFLIFEFLVCLALILPVISTGNLTTFIISGAPFLFFIFLLGVPFFMAFNAIDAARNSEPKWTLGKLCLGVMTAQILFVILAIAIAHYTNIFSGDYDLMFIGVISFPVTAVQAILLYPACKLFIKIVNDEQLVMKIYRLAKIMAVIVLVLGIVGLIVLKTLYSSH